MTERKVHFGNNTPPDVVGKVSFFDRFTHRRVVRVLAVLLIFALAFFAVAAIVAPPPLPRILEYLGIGMGGILLAIQAVTSHRRAKAMEDAAKAQAGATAQHAEANRGAEQGRQQDRMKNAIEHLGNDSDFVRLGGAYELFHLARANEDLRQTALDILCAHIRSTTDKDEYRKKHGSKPSEEIQSLLHLLFVREYKIFTGCYTNLHNSWLNGADLHGAHLEEANLAVTHLRSANFTEAYLQGANLTRSQMQGANFDRAHLQSADLEKTQMQGSYFLETHMQNTHLGRTQLQGSLLNRVEMQEAHFSETNMKGVNRYEPFIRSSFEGTTFADVIRYKIDKESDLSTIISRGGLTEGKVKALTEGLSSWEKYDPATGIHYWGEAQVLRAILESHIDQPVRPASSEPWDRISIHTGAYTMEEAEKWIGEHEEAMFGTPKENN